MRDHRELRCRPRPPHRDWRHGTTGCGCAVPAGGSNGTTITYDKAGERKTAATSSETDTYIYSADGYLTETDIVVGGSNEKSTSQYDLMGRVLHYKEYDTTSSVVYSKDTTYNAVGLDTTDTVYSNRGGSNGAWTWVTTYDYNDLSGSTYTGQYEGGNVVHDLVHTTVTGGPTAPPDANSEFTYVWFDGAEESTESYQPNSTTSWSSFLVYDTRQNLVEANIDDGQARDVFYAQNMLGEITQRDTGYEGGGGGHNNISGPHARYYYFGGIEMGDVSNDGTSNVNYAVSITDHKTKPGTGLFQNGATTETKYADFDASYDTINGLTYDSTPGSYTAQSGDTLQSIAQQIWGDSNFWYLLADANGLDESSTLVAGQQLIIPNKVADNQNNNSTYKVYNPNDAMGDVSPTTPPKPQAHHSNCGIFGEILMAIVAVAVTFWSAGALTPLMQGFASATLGLDGATTVAGITTIAAGSDAAIAGSIMAGVVAGAAGGIASQAFGVATGIQKSFNWGAVALDAISGGVDAGVGANGFDLFSGASEDVQQFLQGATGSAITQGIGVATGLQKSFNWGQVVAAGVSNVVSNEVGDWAEGQSFSSNPIIDDMIGTGLKGVAGLIAGAATRSLISGTDFGDNIMSGLPDVIGQTVGAAYEDEVEQQQQDQFTDLQQRMALLSANSAPQVSPPIDSSLAGSPEYANTEGASPSYSDGLYLEASPRGSGNGGNTSATRVTQTGNISYIDFEPTAWSGGIPIAGTLKTYLWNDQTDAEDSTPATQRDVSGVEGQALGVLYNLSFDAPGLAEQSPTLMSELETFIQNKGVVDVWNDHHGNGTNPEKPEIDLDQDLIGKFASSNDPYNAIATIAHELGHYQFGSLDTGTQDGYIEANELSEGAATINNLKVSDEIYAASGEKIYVLGSNASDYGSIYASYLKGPQTSEALQNAEQQIGDEYAHNENPTTEHLNVVGGSVHYIDIWRWEYKKIPGH